MQYPTTIIRVGNSKGVRLPAQLLPHLESTNVVLELVAEGILIRSVPPVPPLSEWDALLAKADTSLDSDFHEWDNTLSDGLDKA